MQGEQRTEREDREPFHRQQDDQERPRASGQALVAVRAAVLPVAGGRAHLRIGNAHSSVSLHVCSAGKFGVESTRPSARIVIAS